MPIHHKEANSHNDLFPLANTLHTEHQYARQLRIKYPLKRILYSQWN